MSTTSDSNSSDRRTATYREVGEWIKTLGVGRTFTMLEAREVFPGVNQIDRRMRELRECGWKIKTNRQDKNLRPGQYRCDEFGDYNRQPGLSDRVRQAIIKRDHGQCQVCGILAGQSYPDMPQREAIMEVGHRKSKAQGGSATDPANLQAECDRCNGGARNTTGHLVDVNQVEQEIENLGRKDKEKLLGWMQDGRRPMERLERLFAEYRALAPEVRDDITKALAVELG